MLYEYLKKPFFGRYQKPWRWPDHVARDAWHSVAIPSESGVVLAGLYGQATAEPVKGTMVCAHPMLTAAKGFYLAKGHAHALRARGYHVLLFDFNGFGESPSGDFQYPLDVLAAGRWARQRHPDHKIGVLGVSFGAAWSICALAEHDHPFSAAVLECPFTTLEEYWYRHKAAYLTLKVITRLRPALARSLRPIERIRDVSGVESMLFIYGSADDVTPRSMGERFLAAYQADFPDRRAEMWLVPEARHTKAFPTAREDYARRLATCLP